MDGLSGRTPRLLVVVHSGKTTTGRFGCLSSSVDTSTMRAPGDGATCGGANERRIACSREIRSTRRLFGYEAVKIGSNIAARYTASIGEVKDDAMTDPGTGRRAFCCLESDLPPSALSEYTAPVPTHPFLTPSTWRSIHQILGTPRMHHRDAFLPSDPIGSHCSTTK